MYTCNINIEAVNFQTSQNKLINLIHQHTDQLNFRFFYVSFPNIYKKKHKIELPFKKKHTKQECE